MAAALRRFSPRAEIARVGEVKDFSATLPKLSQSTRIIAFSTSIIVPPDVLSQVNGNAYNFHPGPPEFPGNRPSAFACYAQARQFGVTLHKMVEKVDAGEIIDCHRFGVSPEATSANIAVTAYQCLAKLFLKHAGSLAQTSRPLKGNGAVWGATKTTQAMFDAMRVVPKNIDPEELARRIRAFNWVYTSLTDGSNR